MPSNNTFDVIIIGSGVAGLSTAMQLALRGQQVLVVERRELASGATSRAAGLLGQMRSTVDGIRLLMDSVHVMRAVEDRADFDIYCQTGSVRIAQTPARAEELQRDLAVARDAGLEAYAITAADVAELLPQVYTEDILEASYCPSDGYLEAPMLAEAYLRVGRSAGVTYRARTPVESLHIQGGAVKGLRARGEDFYAPVIVNAAGPWTHLVAGLAQQSLPTAGIAHYYFTTSADSGIVIEAARPSLRDREQRIYARPKDGGLRVGIYEASPEIVEMDQLSHGFEMSTVTVPRTHPTVMALVEAAAKRFKGITPDTPLEIRGGIMAFTPDGAALIGECESLRGFYHCAGFCGHGISQSPAIGPLMADLILEGRCQYDLEQINADRFADFPGLENRAAVNAACRAVYANYYNLTEPA